MKNFAKTPGRVRSRPASARETWGAPTFSASKPRTITRSKSFAFESDKRPARPPPKSSAQLEAEALAAVPKFRAQKVSKRVLESSGDVGVPRVQRPPPTQFAEFNLSGIGSMAKRRPSDAGLSSTSVTSVSSEPARPSFKARPMPTYKASGLKAQTPRRMTRPQSPKFVTSQRAATRAAARRAHRGLRNVQGAAGAVVGVEVVARLGRRLRRAAAGDDAAPVQPVGRRAPRHGEGGP